MLCVVQLLCCLIKSISLFIDIEYFPMTARCFQCDIIMRSCRLQWLPCNKALGVSRWCIWYYIALQKVDSLHLITWNIEAQNNIHLWMHFICVIDGSNDGCPIQDKSANETKWEHVLPVRHLEPETYIHTYRHLLFTFWQPHPSGCLAVVLPSFLSTSKPPCSGLPRRLCVQRALSIAWSCQQR